MKYEDFIGFVQRGVQKKLGEEAQTQIRKITKNNSVVLDGLSISAKDSAVSPTIYLNSFYKDYQQGLSIPEIVDHILEMYRRSCVSAASDISFFTDFEKARQGLACRLISRARNQELLEQIPHRPFLNLETVVYYRLEGSELGRGTILVYNSHLERWGITEEKLFEIARENTLRILPERFIPIQNALEMYQEEMDCEQELKSEIEWTGEEGDDEKETCGAEEVPPMYVLTNTAGAFGAVCILYDEVLQRIAEQLEDDFWILPSSIHECIILPAGAPVEKQWLQSMVRQINRQAVEEGEFLSDEIYLYRSRLHKLSME